MEVLGSEVGTMAEEGGGAENSVLGCFGDGQFVLRVGAWTGDLPWLLCVAFRSQDNGFHREVRFGIAELRRRRRGSFGLSLGFT
ncbi:unnamed protein product [Ilex paraguariensis]|uniref:Uncharacterized protein n=1 Tax=Ilex paraguariensis TaxID=185542 RepID=A0ABC8UY32_9AQUA